MSFEIEDKEIISRPHVESHLDLSRDDTIDNLLKWTTDNDAFRMYRCKGYVMVCVDTTAIDKSK